MRTLVIAVSLSFTLAVLYAPIVGAQSQSSLTAFAGLCLTDDEVAANEREAYEKPAMRFVETIIGDKPENAYPELTDELRGKISSADFVRNINQVARTFQPLSDLHVEHSFRESLTALGSGISVLPCTATAHGDSKAPEGRVMIAALPIPIQAHVIVEGKARNNRLAFVVWLVPDKPSWRVTGYYVVPTTILDKTATDVTGLARRERQRGNALNSYILYATAAQLAYRGPYLQLGIQPEIEKEKAALAVPPELKGDPPFEWEFGNDHYHIVVIGPIGVGGVFDLRIEHRVAQTTDNRELDRQNRALIKEFKQAHPEYAQVFDGLLVQALMPNGSGFGTVEQNQIGQ